MTHFEKYVNIIRKRSHEYAHIYNMGIHVDSHDLYHDTDFFYVLLFY